MIETAVYRINIKSRKNNQSVAVTLALADEVNQEIDRLWAP